jgi:hemerythrin-like metal-binding protein
MTLIKWSDKYSVHIKIIDEQHQKFIRMINELSDRVVEESLPSTVGEILDQLLDYTNYHFKTEEDLFKTHNYPGFEIHKQQHDAFVKQVFELKEDFSKGRITITLKILAFLNEWLINHILDSDQKYASYLNEKGVH